MTYTRDQQRGGLWTRKQGCLEKWSPSADELLLKEWVGSASSAFRGVHIAKPLVPERIAAEETVLKYANHPNSWVRHEVLWLVTWAKLLEHRGILLHALLHDSNSDNRGFAALCLSHLLQLAQDSDAVRALKGRVLDDHEDMARQRLQGDAGSGPHRLLKQAGAAR